MSEAHKGHHHTQETKDKFSEVRKKDFKVEFPNGEIKICHGYSEVAEAIGRNYDHHVGEVMSGKRARQQYAGYQFTKINNAIA